MTDQEWLKEILKVESEEDMKITEKQSRIIQAAIEIFAEKGYSSTSTSEIAKRAGVAEGTIFRHYKTKKDLLVSIVSPMMAKLIAPFVIRDLNKVLDGKYERFEEFLRALIENRRVFLKKNWQVIKIFIQEIPFHPELKEPFKEHVAEKVFERLSSLVKHFQEKDEIIEIPPPSVIRLVGTTIMGYLLFSNVIAPELDWEEKKEDDITIEFIMNGIGTKKE